MKFSLLNRDLRSRLEKIKDYHDQKVSQKLNDKLNHSKNNKIKFNHSYDNTLSKVGLGNTMRGTNEVLKNLLNVSKQNINNMNHIKENTMSIQSPIKQIILEFTADHIRDNAGKYAAGTMLGLGAAAGYLAGDPEHGMGHNNEETSYRSGVSQNPLSHDTRSDFQKDLGNASTTKSIEYHNDNKGLLGNLSNSVNHFTNNMRAENKFNDMAQAQEDYNNLKNSNGELLTAGQKLGLGAAGLGAAAVAAKLRRRR